MAINLKNIKTNVPQVRLEDYFWVVAGVPKAGKTSLFAKLTEKYFGDLSKSLLLAFEKGYQALKVQAVDIGNWDDFDETVEQLVTQKKELGLEFIGIDTADILNEYATDQVIKEWNRANPSKRTKDIGGVGAKGNSSQGFGVGYSLVKKKIRDNIDKLVKAGYGVMVLTHSKDKKVEQKDGLEYDQLNVSLPSTSREIFVNMADFIVFLTVEKEKDANDHIVTKRYMYFRSDGFVEAGSRFSNVPLKIEYNVDDFIQTFKDAVEAEFASGVDIDQIKKEQAERREKAAQEYVEEQISTPKMEDLIKEIDTKVSSLSKEQKGEVSNDFKKILGGTNNYKLVDDIELLQKCLDIVNKLV